MHRPGPIAKGYSNEDPELGVVLIAITMSFVIGQCGEAAAANVTAAQIFGQPENLTVTPGNVTVTLSWDWPADLTAFGI